MGCYYKMKTIKLTLPLSLHFFRQSILFFLAELHRNREFVTFHNEHLHRPHKVTESLASISQESDDSSKGGNSPVWSTINTKQRIRQGYSLQPANAYSYFHNTNSGCLPTQQSAASRVWTYLSTAHYGGGWDNTHKVATDKYRTGMNLRYKNVYI